MSVNLKLYPHLFVFKMPLCEKDYTGLYTGNNIVKVNALCDPCK